MLVGTGLAAVTVPLMAYLKTGDHCLMPDSAYGPARNVCNGLLKDWGVETTYYDPLIDEAGIRALIRPNTKVVYTESPGSHTFEVQDVPAIARELLTRNGHLDGVVRVLILRDGASVRCLVTSRLRSHLRCVTLLPCVARRPSGGPAAAHKCEPRSFYDAVLAEARAGGADDGIVVGDDGAVLETAVGNLWLCLGGMWVTPPLDGRVLPGIARGLVLEHAWTHGIPVAEGACSLSDLHRATALMVTNAVHGPRAAQLPGQTVQELDTRLLRLWRSVVPD